MAIGLLFFLLSEYWILDWRIQETSYYRITDLGLNLSDIGCPPLTKTLFDLLGIHYSSVLCLWIYIHPKKNADKVSLIKFTHHSTSYLSDWRGDGAPEVGVLDESLSQLIPLQRSCRTGPPAYIIHRLEPCPSYVAWRTGTATPLSGIVWLRD